MKEYLDLVRDIKENGVYKGDRTGTGCYSVFGRQMRFNLADGFPLVTSKKTHLKSIIHELLWFLQGETNIRYLKEHGVSIWDEWIDPDTAEYRPATTKEIVDTIEKDTVLHDEFLLWNEPYFGRVEREGYIRTQSPFKMEGVETPVYWGHPDHDNLIKEWAEEHGVETQVLVAGALGPVYGKQWRSWPDKDGETIDQITNLIDTLKNNPDSRRMIVTAWNPAEVDDMALPPCHCLFQFYTAPMSVKERVEAHNRTVSLAEREHNQKTKDGMDNELITWAYLSVPGLREWSHAKPNEEGLLPDEDAHAVLDRFEVPSRKLSCQLYQRSMDVFLGCPFNIASYALLTCMIAQVVNMVPGEFIHTSGDTHLYANHMEQVEELLTREPLPLPTLKLNPEVKDLFAFTYDDIEVVGYKSHPAIKAPVAV